MTRHTNAHYQAINSSTLRAGEYDALHIMFMHARCGRSTLMTMASIFAVFAVFAAAGLACSAFAQTADHSSCAPWKAKWAEASKGADLAAIDDVIGKIPALCPALKAEAAAGKAAAVKKAEQARIAAAQQQAALEAAKRANDPCLQARNDWSHVQTASEDTVRAYRDSLPAACAVWRNEAQTKLAVMVAERTAKAEEAERQRIAAAEEADRQRVATEKKQAAALAAAQTQREQAAAEAARIEAMVVAAKAAGIEGRWVTSKSNQKLCGEYEQYTVEADGRVEAHVVSSDRANAEFLRTWLSGPLESAAGKTVRWNGNNHIVTGDEMQISGFPERRYRCG